MRRKIKLAALQVLKRSGAFRLVANSSWRQEKLLILCYHGISLEDEHLWRPRLYMQPELLAQRLETLHAMKCSVLPLAEALARLQARDLPPRSVALTFDDGTYDFYKQAYPLLSRLRLPVTVYQTTYYTDHEIPIFNLMCSYLLWKGRGREQIQACDLGFSEAMDIRTELGRHQVVRRLVELSQREQLNGQKENEIVQRMAGILGIDYAEIAAKRILQLMNSKEVAEVASKGIDIQLHSHRHRAPLDEAAFRKEITDNRERIRALTGREANHFCYPSGVYRQKFGKWLKQENVLTATTCDAGLVDRRDDPYFLSRFVDTSARTAMEFESWIGGIGSLIALSRTAPQQYVVPDEEG